MWLPSKHMQQARLQELPWSSLLARNHEKSRFRKESHCVHLVATTQWYNSTKVPQTQMRQGVEHIAKQNFSRIHA